jgi:hypothetical protein
VGITIASWQQSLLNRLRESGFDLQLEVTGGYNLIDFKSYGQLVLNLVSLDDLPDPPDLVNLQQHYQSDDIQLIQLWEDVWLTREEQVLSRINALAGKNKKVHGRKTIIRTITQPEADDFLDRFHLQGSVKGRFRYALEAEGETVAVALFSGKRSMTRKSPDYKSVELMRFANAAGVTVQGGLSKLIKHVMTTLSPDDVMTYADLDWSYGKGYTKLGFELVEQSPPAFIWLSTPTLNRAFPHRLPEELKSLLSAPDAIEKMRSLQYLRVFNTGNLKYILHT